MAELEYEEGQWVLPLAQFVYKECVHALQTGAWPRSRATVIRLRR